MGELSIFCRTFAEHILRQCVECNSNSDMELAVKNVPSLCTAVYNPVNDIDSRNGWKLFNW